MYATCSFLAAEGEDRVAHLLAGRADVAAEDFEELIARALDALPERFVRLLDNVVVVQEDEPSVEDLLSVFDRVDGSMVANAVQMAHGLTTVSTFAAGLRQAFREIALQISTLRISK